MKKKIKPKNKELVLVTGGAGFIGGHLADALLARGYRVRVLDNLAPPAHNGRLPDWFNTKIEFIRGDVRNKKDWVKALKGVSSVFHLAGYMDFHLDFSSYIDVNTKSTALLYEVIVEKKYPVKKIIVASSQAVYGEGKYYCKKHGVIYSAPREDSQLDIADWEVRCPYDKSVMKPLTEKEEDAVYPSNPYGISKKTLEELTLYLGRLYKIPSVALRYSIVHGPRQNFRNSYSGALRQFSVMALNGEPFHIHEDGLQKRDFVHIEDVISAHLALLEHKKDLYGIFNVGSGRANTVRDLVFAIAKRLGVEPNYKIGNLYRLGTARNSIMDVSKLKRLGWRPRRSLEDNVKDYLAWARNYYPEAKKYLKKTSELMEKLRVVKKAKNLW